MDETKATVIIIGIIAAVAAVIIVFGFRQCDADHNRRTEYLKTCVSAGKSPLECKASVDNVGN